MNRRNLISGGLFGLLALCGGKVPNEQDMVDVTTMADEFQRLEPVDFGRVAIQSNVNVAEELLQENSNRN